MARGKFEKKRNILPLVLILLAVITLGSTTGGVAAYLSTSAEKPLTNTFTVADPPTVSVSGTTVTVTAPGYPVYLRVAVAANTMNGSHIVAGKDIACTVSGENWETVGEFHYYKVPLNNGESVEVPVTAGGKVTIAAQVIQAEGTVDNGTQLAKDNAWTNSGN